MISSSNDGPGNSFSDFFNVLTIDLDAGNAISSCSCDHGRQKVRRSRLRDCPTVILTDKDDRKAPEGSQIYAFVHIATICNPVPKGADDDIIVCLHAQSQCRSRRHTYACSKVARNPWYDVEFERPSKGN